ncbi:MAG: hypothetical protein SNJ57_13280, partial [Cyanobacteriota bacterium]
FQIKFQIRFQIKHGAKIPKLRKFLLMQLFCIASYLMSIPANRAMDKTAGSSANARPNNPKSPIQNPKSKIDTSYLKSQVILTHLKLSQAMLSQVI